MRRIFLFCTAALGILNAAAQTTYLQLNHEDYPMYDRLEALSGHLSNDIFTTVKPFARKGAVKFLLDHRAQGDEIGLSKIDEYNIDHAISVSGEWAPEEAATIKSRKPWFNTFYKTQADFFRVKTPDFFLSVNPVIGLQASYETEGTDNTHIWNSRGIELRGTVAGKVGFYTYFTDNQEDVPSFTNAWIASHEAVPGADYYQRPAANKYDYLLARGYVDFAAVKDHINVTLGYDKHFIGDGMRSLFLSDFASSGMPFLRLTTKVWRLNYQNLYVELTPNYKRGGDRRLPHKYATIHHLSVNATRWLNVGLFEAVVFDRKNAYEFAYLNPIILYRQAERAAGSPDNALLGINFKAIAAHSLQVYGQFLLDEFKLKELTGGKGWWGNKFGIQLGAKYFNAFTVKNLDLQAEVNVVRPYTYTHNDSIASYTHYNQPLAHPLGAGFAELTGIARYQPIQNLYLSLKGTYYNQGVDTGGGNYGSNIFMPSTTKSETYGVSLVNGYQQNVILMNLNASYELRENVFFDLGVTHRTATYDSQKYYKDAATTYVYGGLRLNLARRDYDFQ